MRPERGRGYRRPMSCDMCGARRPTKYVEFYQNIGVVVLRFSKSVKGDLCKPCINQSFWSLTLVTLALGWWGIISFFVTPIFLIQNTARFLTTIGMDREQEARPARGGGGGGGGEPSGHPTLSLTPEATAKLDLLRAEIAARLSAGEAADDVAASIARKAGVSGVQAELYIHRMG